MAIQNRRGLKKDFDPAKMLPGEFAVSIDSETENQIVWMCFAPGVVKRIGTYEDFEQYLSENCKTAYEYAVEGGYAGTEGEFKAKMAQECADAIVASASGAVIAVSDSAEQRLKRLLLHGKSTQDGTPSPSAQIDIISAGKYNEATGKYDVDVKINGKNLSPVQSWVSEGENKSGYFALDIKSHGTYTFSAYVTKYSDDTATNTRLLILVYYTDGSFDISDYTSDSDNSERDGVARLKQSKITTDTSKTISAFIVKCSDYSSITGGRNAKAENIQLEVGTTATPYEAYKEQTVTLSLSEPIRSLPDGTSDIVHVDRATGTAWVERKIIEFVLDGSADELWALAGTNTSGKYRPDCYSYRNICKGYTDNTIPSNVYCNQFVAMSPNKNYSCNESIALRYDGDVFIYEEAYAEKTLDEFKARLSDNPITIIAELATPTIEELPEETVNQLLALTAYYPNTTITTDQGVTMEVDYVADTKNYIDNLKTQHEADIQTLKTAIIALGGSV